MSGYPKATCDPGTEALRLANERADRWKQRHDALATRLASAPKVEIIETLNAPTRCKVWVDGRLVFAGQDYTAVLGSDAHTEQKGTGE